MPIKPEGVPVGGQMCCGSCSAQNGSVALFCFPPIIPSLRCLNWLFSSRRLLMSFELKLLALQQIEPDTPDNAKCGWTFYLGTFF